MNVSKSTPTINTHLLWEYDISTFNFDSSKQVVIERIIERGRIEDWHEMMAYYGKEKVLKVAARSKQLSERDKNFTIIFVESPLAYAS